MGPKLKVIEVNETHCRGTGRNEQGEKIDPQSGRCHPLLRREGDLACADLSE